MIKSRQKFLVTQEEYDKEGEELKRSKLEEKQQKKQDKLERKEERKKNNIKARKILKIILISIVALIGFFTFSFLSWFHKGTYELNVIACSILMFNFVG